MRTQRPSMRTNSLVILIVLSAVIELGQATRSVHSASLSNEKSSNSIIQQNFGQLPLTFIPNAGQTDELVHFQVNSLDGTLFFAPQEVMLSLPQVRTDFAEQKMVAPTSVNRRPMTDRSKFTESDAPLVVKMQLIGASANAEIKGADSLPGIVNYFIGNDASKWHANIPTYAGIVISNAATGISNVEALVYIDAFAPDAGRVLSNSQ